MDISELSSVFKCFTAIVVESFPHLWIFMLQLKLVLSKLAQSDQVYVTAF